MTAFVFVVSIYYFLLLNFVKLKVGLQYLVFGPRTYLFCFMAFQELLRKPRKSRKRRSPSVDVVDEDDLD